MADTLAEVTRPGRVNADPGIVDRHARALGWLGILFGLTIIGCHIESGGDRWSAAAWTFALEIPGSPATWGVVILIGGALIMAGRQRQRLRWRVYGYWLSCVWFCSLGAAAALAFLGDIFGGDIHTVNPLSIITWICFASMYRLQIRDEHAKPAP